MAEIQRNEQTQNQVAEISPEYSEQLSGTVGTTVETISLVSPTQSILIKNTHTANSLSVKFRSSKSGWNSAFTTIDKESSLSLDIRTTMLKLKGSGANTTYEILATKE